MREASSERKRLVLLLALKPQFRVIPQSLGRRTEDASERFPGAGREVDPPPRGWLKRDRFGNGVRGNSRNRVSLHGPLHICAENGEEKKQERPMNYR
jgi:hypothetical protein